MKIEVIRERVQAGNYLVKGHAVQHAVKEGFERRNMVEVALTGKVIEEYPDDQRLLICGRTTLFENGSLGIAVVAPTYGGVVKQVVG